MSIKMITNSNNKDSSGLFTKVLLSYCRIAQIEILLITTEFNRLPIPLTCLNGLRYMLNFNMSLVFYKPPADVYPAEAREQCYHVTTF